MVKDYGVWRAKPVSYTFEDRVADPHSPHLSLYFDDGQGAEGRAAINIKSGNKEESRLAYWTVPNFTHGVTAKLAQLSNGFQPLAGASEQRLDGLALDYIRSNLFNRAVGRILPHDVDGADNDILDQLRPIIDRAISTKATVYIYGSEFNDGKGIHNVHMNQGNSGRWLKDNGVFQDGGLIFQFEDHWEAVFIGFASQAVHTEDGPKRAGYPLPDQDFMTWANLLAPELSDDDKEKVDIEDSPVFIVQALVNPPGPDQQPGTAPETISLKNRTGAEIDLSGWKIRIKTGDTQILPSGSRIGPADTKTIETSVPLSNNGGTITLLNAKGFKVHGVSYTRAEANGAVIVF
ncbi:yukJ [Fusarium subglutinans]|uniref:YukJ n=1 Tax=Gibberella subglutinans TaxID=42677 RepID=A0A8H5PDN9_GIBSU|nr:yukJ [Fusarium subglutinans]KAF5594895.1 yukJ [Fusarium subglutinans]